jgi:hypothetical protein
MERTVPCDDVPHCVAKIRALVLLDEPDRRALLQLGYNLGRLGELTGLGRGPTWDRWKGPVADWDRPALETLARELQDVLHTAHPSRPVEPDRPTR